MSVSLSSSSRRQGGEVRYRLARADEVGALQTLEERAGRRFEELIREERFRHLALPEGELSAARLLASIGAGCTWVAEVSDETAGFLCATPLRASLFVEEVDVLPRYGRRGIGSGLMACAERRTLDLGVPRLLLSTFREVPWNGPWYVKLGFEILPEEDLDAEAATLREAELHRGFLPDQRVMMAKSPTPEGIGAVEA